MILSILYVLLALLGISFLIFIHELGHYFMARKVGITVEVFSIGFGKSIIEWEHKGVKWKIGILPFGGYVKMAGMEKQGPIEPYQVEGGYFGAKPWNRIKVAIMGPLVNIAFAFIAFSFLWVLGGRNKPFSEYTHLIGWVEPGSSPYQAELRPGDEISQVNGRPFKGFNDFLYAAVLDRRPLQVTGFEIDYPTQAKKPFTYIFPTEPHLKGVEKASVVLNTVSPASYLISDTLPSGSPLEGSGLEKGDRIVWVDGELIFSQKELIQTVNSSKVLLGIEREGKRWITRVPRLQVRDLRIAAIEREELDDWRNEAGLSRKVELLSFIPYNLNSQGVVEGVLSYIDEKSEKKLAFDTATRSPMEIPLLPGDRIVSVQGKNIHSAYELLKELQVRKNLVIIEKGKASKTPSWKEADKEFLDQHLLTDLEKMVETIASDTPLTQVGSLSLLPPVTPVPMSKFPMTSQQTAALKQRLETQKKAIEEIPDPKQREEALKDFQLYQNRLMLGLVLQDKQVAYNPAPFALFGDVLKETYRTLFALVTGYLSPKNISGPVGIVQVIHYGWSVGVKEAVFWLGMISLNLGLLNLLPIPILDGGHICLALFESVTKKPLKAKAMERLILPFVVLFILLFVYLTYNDIVRIIKSLF